MFQSVWGKLGGTQYSEDKEHLIAERVRFFFLNLHYLWGEWLLRDKLLAEEKRPDRSMDL